MSRIIFPIISGLLAAAAYPPSYVPWIIWISFVPFLLFIFSETNKKRLFWGGAAGGFIYAALVLRWVFSILPIDWLPFVPNHIGVVGVILYWLVTASVIATGWGLFGLISVFLIHKPMPPVARLFCVGGVWILIEYLWATALSVAWMGSGTPIGPHWTFGSLADIFSSFPFLLPFLRLGGPLLGSGFIMVVNLLVVMGIHACHSFAPEELYTTIKKGGGIAFLVLFAGIFFPEGEDTGAQNSLTVAVLQSDAPPYLTTPESRTAHKKAWKNLYAIAGAAAEQSAPDVFIFPEGAGFSLEEPILTPLLINSLRTNKKPLLVIDTGIRATPTNSSLEVLYLDAEQGLIGKHGKTLLVPGGEYLPFVFKGFLALMKAAPVEDELFSLRFYTANDSEAYPVLWQNTLFGTLPCSGVFSASLYRSLTHNGAGILVNTASLTLFHDSAVFAAQVRAKAQIQAAGLERPLLQATNNGTSFIVDTQGKIVMETNRPDITALIGTVVPSPSKTPYNRFGNWPVPIMVVLLGKVFFKNLTKIKKWRSVKVRD